MQDETSVDELLARAGDIMRTHSAVACVVDHRYLESKPDTDPATRYPELTKAAAQRGLHIFCLSGTPPLDRRIKYVDRIVLSEKEDLELADLVILGDQSWV